MWLFIEPLDILLFRESKPFAAGEGFWARSVFPPSGLPLMGALRAKIIVDSGTSFKDYQFFDDEKNGDNSHLAELVRLIGKFDDYGELQLQGPFISQIENNEQNTYFPAPLDIIKSENSNTISNLVSQNFPWGLEISKTLPTDGINNLYSPIPLWTNDSGDLPENKFVKTIGLLNYLQGATNSETTDAEDLWGNERQVGIEKSLQGTAEKSKIYSVEFTRLKENEKDTWKLLNTGLLVYFKDVPEQYFKSDGFLALGGESRAAKYQIVDETQIDKFKMLIEGDFLNDSTRGIKGKKQFKLYLSTPAIFNNGWYPDFLELENTELISKKDGLEFKLVSASIAKSKIISGWNVAERKPRAAVKSVPAGSVYYFELTNGEVFDEEKINILRKNFHFKNLNEKDYKSGCLTKKELTRYGKAGFGLALIGKVKEA